MTEMDLKTYLLGLTIPEREKFARRCHTTRGHLQNVMYGLRPCDPKLAVSVEKESGGAVKRSDLRDDWKAIWPELAKGNGSSAGHCKEARA